MRIALCQFNPRVGAIINNADGIKRYALEAKSAGADLIVFPELSICGYPPRDMLFRRELHAQISKSLRDIADSVQIPVIVGAPMESHKKTGQPFWNAAVCCHKGKVSIVCRKQLLPNYGVFDEQRYFEPGSKADGDCLFSLGKLKLGFSICEDAWANSEDFMQTRYLEDPIQKLKTKGADIIVNMSASPFCVGKPEHRDQLFSGLAQKHNLPVLKAGQVGANDQLIFDGHSMVIDAQGKILSRLNGFAEGLLWADINEDGELIADETGQPPVLTSKIDQMRRALVLGIKDYVGKCGAPGVVLGLSGGIDSAVTAALAVEALGSEKVTGIRMPSQFSSVHSLVDAEKLAKNLKIKLLDIPIENVVESHRASLKSTSEKHQKNAELADQNLQARVRGVLLMAVSNLSNQLVLSTGNKSEIAMGYTTLYGDMCGALSPLGDVYKTDVWALAKHINRFQELIPENSINKPPSAELKEDQCDEDTLLPYNLLDQVLVRYVDEDMPMSEIAQEVSLKSGELDKIAKTVQANDYKRRQGAIILMVSKRVFELGRRWPTSKGNV